MTDARQSLVVAVVVTYRPAPRALMNLLAALEPQVAAVIVADNGSTVLPESAGRETEIVSFGDNLGVAAAQNRGIARARLLNADYVLLMDQDSEPAPDMVARLLDAARRTQETGIRVAAIGPNCVDARSGAQQPFMRQGQLFYRRVRCPPGDTLIEVSDLISSGSLLPVATLDAVGGMNEGLFIDYVDTEWLLRARHHGYRAFGACAAKMRHELGDKLVALPGRTVVLHSALRHYYMFRNAVWAYRQSWVPLQWKRADAWRLLQRGVFYALFARPRAEHLRMILRGLRDGWHGRMGRFDPDPL
jgi:rhamnosyltransferase